MQPINYYYCEDYPVLNYTLELTNVLSSEVSSCMYLLSNDWTSADNLSEDTIYTFRVIVTSDFGAFSTGNHIIRMSPL